LLHDPRPSSKIKTNKQTNKQTTTQQKVPSEGERKLLFAVLEDAIRTYLRHRDNGALARNNEDYVEAAEWLSSDDEDGPFAFVNICEALGIDADGLRSGISSHTGRLEEIRT